jgi:hypothetical protein
MRYRVQGVSRWSRAGGGPVPAQVNVLVNALVLVLVLVLVLAAGCGAADGPAGPVADLPADAGAFDVPLRSEDAAAPLRDAAPGADRRGGLVIAVPPRLVVERPPNGLWAGEVAEVVVAGVVTPGSAPLASLSIADAPVAVGPDGRFSYVVRAQPGLNLVGLRAEAEDGGRAVDARAFHAGPTNPPGALLSRAVQAHLTPAFLDDDDEVPDDLARLTELLLEDPAFLAGLDEPIATDVLTIQPTSVEVAGAAVDVFAGDGVLSLVVRLAAPVIRFQTVAAEGEAPSSGVMRADLATLQLDLALSVAGGAAVCDARYVDAELEGFSLEADGLFPDYFDELPAVVDLTRSIVEAGIEGETAALVGGLVGDLLTALALDVTYGETPPITFHLALEDLQVTRRGLHLAFAASATAPPGPGVHNADVAGSFRTVSTPPPVDFARDRVAFAVDDDFVNQLAFAYWYGGGLTRREFLPEDMADVGATALPDAFSPLRRIEVSATLPLVLSAEPAGADFPFRMAMGDMQVELETETDKRFALFLSLAAGVDLAVEGDGADRLRLRADRRPPHVPVHVAAYAVPRGNDAGNVAALVRLMVPPILGRTNEGLPAFPVPGIPLATFLDLPALAAQEIALPGLTVRTAGAEGHFLVLEGAPVLRDAPPEPPPDAP